MSQTSCYCGFSVVDSEICFICSICERKVHFGCQLVHSPSLLHGDVLFQFTCQFCSPSGVEQYSRIKLQWLQVVKLALYNLQRTGAISNNGYYRWKEHICEFIDSNWQTIFGEPRPVSQSWVGNVTGALSLGCPKHFISGQTELQENGWWKLAVDRPPMLEPNQISNARKTGGGRGRGRSTRRGGKRKTANGVSADFGNSLPSPHLFPSALSVKAEPDSDDCDLDIDVSDLMTSSDHLLMDSLPPVEDLLTVFGGGFDNIDAIQSGSGGRTRLLSEYLPGVPGEMEEWPDVGSKLMAKDSGDEADVKPSVGGGTSGGKVEQSRKVKRRRVATAEKPVNGATDTKPSSDRFVRITSYEEHQMLVKLQQADSYLTPDLRRLRAKLRVQQLKRQHGVPVFDLDEFIQKRSDSVGVAVSADLPPPISSDKRDDWPSSDVKPPISESQPNQPSLVLDRFLTKSNYESSSTKPISFLSRLVGNEDDSLNPIRSPYTGRLLKPFIRRDYDSCPLKLRLLRELHAYHDKKDPTRAAVSNLPIDYSYVRLQHIAAANALCHEFFWPGIDLSECLQYPDFSCVALYRKLVIGFAFLVPDVNYRYNEAYLSFIFTHPEWRRAGIARFMLYHLIQTCGGRDITLHVSVNNPALLLYQQFGFKPEELILDFYDKYFPTTSSECRHAFYLRLRR